MDKSTLAPEWMLDAAFNFKDGNPGLPDDLLVPDVSELVYAWYFQGRDHTILKKGKLDENLPNMQLIDDGMNEDGVTWYKHAEYENVLYKELDGELEKYYVYPKVEKPIIHDAQLYSVMLDLFNLIKYYDNFFAMKPLEIAQYDALMEVGHGKLFDYEVEIVLAIMAPWYHSTLTNKLINRINDDPQNKLRYVNPDATKTGLDYKQSLIDNLPTYLGVVLPHTMLEHVHVRYPLYDIIPRERLTSYPKIVDVSFQNRRYAVDEMTLLERLEMHLPDVVSQFTWKINDSGCVIAGGFLQALSNDICYENGTYKNSDIDVFIYGSEGMMVLEKLVTVLDKAGYGFTIRGSIINATKQDEQVIQIVCNTLPHFYHVIYRFDNSACQLAYDGSDLYVTPDFIHYVTYGESRFFAPEARSYRILKSVDRGYVPVYDGLVLLDSRPISYQYNKVGDLFISNSGHVLYNERPELIMREVDVSDVLYNVTFMEFKSASYNGEEIPLFNERSLFRDGPFRTFGHLDGSYFHIPMFANIDQDAFDGITLRVVSRDVIVDDPEFYEHIFDMDRYMRDVIHELIDSPPEDVYDRHFQEMTAYNRTSFINICNYAKETFRGVFDLQRAIREPTYTDVSFNNIAFNSELEKHIYVTLQLEMTTSGMELVLDDETIIVPKISLKFKTLPNYIKRIRRLVDIHNNDRTRYNCHAVVSSRQCLSLY